MVMIISTVLQLKKKCCKLKRSYAIVMTSMVVLKGQTLQIRFVYQTLISTTMLCYSSWDLNLKS